MTHTIYVSKCVISILKKPKNKIDVYLQPLIDKLNELWDLGMKRYDISMSQIFQVKVVLMWTVIDFSAYQCYPGGVLMVNWHV